MSPMPVDPTPTTGTVPLHHQIADALRAQIASGALAPGDSLPTLAELREQWNCAPITVRNAFSVLMGEGLISGGRGKAKTVRIKPRRIRVAVGRGQLFKDNVHLPADERGKVGASELNTGVSIKDTIFEADYDIIEADEKAAELFGLAPGTKLLQRTYETIERATNHRILYSVSRIPLYIIEPNPQLLDPLNEPWPGGHQHQLYTVGVEVDRFETSITAGQPTTAEQQRWGIEPGVPMLKTHGKTIDTHDRVVEASISTYPADRTEIVFTDQLKRW